MATLGNRAQFCVSLACSDTTAIIIRFSCIILLYYYYYYIIPYEPTFHCHIRVIVTVLRNFHHSQRMCIFLPIFFYEFFYFFFMFI